ncbi:ATP-binding protein [Mycolicibacterium sp. 3033]|nr:ATP-binding protein [Mycolicibacterium aurantiacum]
MSEHAEAAGVTLAVHKYTRTAATEFVVLGFAAALRRALTSLVDNALSHEHIGGSIQIRLHRCGPHVVIAVRDDGVGVDPDAVDGLFERFSNGHTHTAGRERYGIGLALVCEIAVAHQGDVSVAHTPGGGATFTLTLAAAPPG